MASATVCVAMQPTYLPWLGYFDLMAESDLFVFLDHVQFEKESWQNRNRVKSPEGWLWLTVPVTSPTWYLAAAWAIPPGAAKHRASAARARAFLMLIIEPP